MHNLECSKTGLMLFFGWGKKRKKEVKNTTSSEELAEYAAILMSKRYYKKVEKAVKADDREDFNAICQQAEIPESAWDELWNAALGTQTEDFQAMSAGW